MRPYPRRSLSPTLQGRNFRPSHSALPLLTPTHAWRLLCRRTGGKVSRTTFYRWISTGRVGTVRVGFRFLVPLPLLEELVQKCLDGERL